MDGERWNAIKEVFERSLSVPPRERQAFVERVAGADDELRDEVLALLQRDRSEDRSLEPQRVSPPSSSDYPRLTGPYRIEGVLGRGGMGTVYLAVQADDESEGLVAIKVLRRGLDTDDILERFRIEREVLADLVHPGIARLHDAGTTDDGRPFLVMELVEGVPIDRHCTERGLDRAARVRLLIEVCAAVQHAHEIGVVHRDLKPSNVLVTREGRPKLVDFGIAKLVGVQGDAALVDVTATDRRLMTPAYASPEQVRGERVSVATDVYALGILLYELLAGARPYRFETGTSVEIERVVCEEAPTNPRIDAALDTIVLMALRKEPERRYASVRELANDLERWLDRRPILARRETWRFRLARYVRRNRIQVVAASAVVLALIAGLAAEKIRREEARAERDKVLRLSAFQELEDLRTEADALWPPRAERLPELDAWLRAADDLVAGLQPRDDDPGHLARLAELEARGRRVGSADAARWEFATDEERWWHGQLVKLIAEIRAFADPEHGPVHGLSTDVGWGVARRRAWAAEGSARDEAHRRRWEEAARSIADVDECPRYAGLVIAPQVDLVPLGRDERSGLWEFLHRPTGDAPARSDDDRWTMEDASGIVFVLIPGGSFRMGAQSADAAAENYNAEAAVEEAPVHEVDVSPFFLSKYELTQAQWLRLTGSNPSFYSEEYRNRELHITLTNPVESVEWFVFARVFRQWGLTLPSEAQWEYAARAGTSTPWWTGVEPESLATPVAANLKDLAAQRADMDWARSLAWTDYDDGFAGSAPVDALAPNPFGLHGVVGNVAEWCRDRYDRSYYQRSPRVDPVCADEDARDRVTRGGSFYDTAGQSRASARVNEHPAFRDFNIGARPARPLERWAPPK